MAARPRTTAAALVGVAVVLAVVGALLFARSVNRAARGADLVAVAPFETVEAGADRWREALVELLPPALARGGAFRAVEPATVRRLWRGGAGAKSARDLGRAAGARFVVFGGLALRGGDSVRVRATVLDVFTGTVAADAVVAGTTADLALIADSLAAAIRGTMRL